MQSSCHRQPNALCHWLSVQECIVLEDNKTKLKEVRALMQHCNFDEYSATVLPLMQELEKLSNTLGKRKKTVNDTKDELMALKEVRNIVLALPALPWNVPTALPCALVTGVQAAGGEKDCAGKGAFCLLHAVL
jgi:hypothetical protein